MSVLIELYQAFVTVLVAIFSTIEITFSRYPNEASIGLYITIVIIQSPIKIVLNASFDLMFYLSRSAVWVKSFADWLFENVRNHSEQFSITYRRDFLSTLAYSIPLTLVALGGVLFNFQLLERPLALWSNDIYEILGFNFTMAEISAAMIIGFELIFGILFMEAIGGSSLGILEFMENMDQEKVWRKRLAWLFGLILLSFSIFEVVLALQRDVLIQGGVDLDNRSQRNEQIIQDGFNPTPAIEEGTSESNGAQNPDNGIGRRTTTVRQNFLSTTSLTQAAVGFIMPWVLMFTVMFIERVVMSFPIILKGAIASVAWIAAVPFLAINYLGEHSRKLVLGFFEILVAPLTILAKAIVRIWDETIGRSSVEFDN